MNFLSIQFALFLAVVVPGYHLLGPRHRPGFLLLASYAFYCLWNPLSAVFILGTTLFTHVVGLAVERERDAEVPRQRVLLLGVGALLGYLLLFKLISPVKTLLETTRMGSEATLSFLATHAILPLGISYYTFRLLSYIIDVGWGKRDAERRFVHFAAYVAFFPHIVAGPPPPGGEFLEQLETPRATEEMMQRGLRRLLLGCFKKAVIADNLVSFIALSYPHHQLPTHSTLLAFYLFPLQMFADFSALTDIAVGAGLLLGIESPENFDYPFLAPSISQYWRRWHMSLTRWLTDYLFMPLRMATRRAGKWGLAFSLIANMVLIGIWHEISWCFVIFGLLHGIFLAVDTLTARDRATFFETRPALEKAATLLGPVFTYHLVALGMVFVLAESVPQALSVLSHLFTVPADGFGLYERETVYGLSGLALWIVFDGVRRFWPKHASAPVWARWGFYYSVIGVIVRYGHNAENFIYYKF